MQVLIVLTLTAICLLSGFVAIGMTYYLGRTKAKEIDKLVHGYELPDDNIFAQILRIPNYGGVFASHWFAKRCHLVYIRDHFDKKFQRPFIITHLLFMFGIVLMILLVIWDNFFSQPF